MSPEFAHQRPASRRPLVWLCALGVGVRLVFLLLAGGLEFQSDEANYLYLAATWNWFGFYSDSYRYFWPPGYPFFLAACLRWFQHDGLFAAKLLQVLASASTGWFVMLFAERLFERRAAWIAGLAWCFYLPLIGFTHYFWTETLFLAVSLPCWYLLLLVLQEPDAPRTDWRVIGAGVLFAASLYLKEVGLYLAPVLAALMAAFAWRVQGLRALPGGTRRGLLFMLTITVLVAPWALRNYEVYGRVMPVGTSLGENAHLGLNESYKNFDTFPLARHRFDRPAPQARPFFIESEKRSGWSRAERILNTADRVSRNAYRGYKYAREHPGWFLRSRVKKIADGLIPVSFFVRHQALEHYDHSPLGARGVRRALVLIAIASSAAVLFLGLVGYGLVLRDRATFWLITTLGLYFASTTAIVAMSRFRVPLVPLLMVLGAGLLTGHARQASRARRVLVTTTVALALGAFWWIDYPEISGLVSFAWKGSD